MVSLIIIRDIPFYKVHFSCDLICDAMDCKLRSVFKTGVSPWFLNSRNGMVSDGSRVTSFLDHFINGVRSHM